MKKHLNLFRALVAFVVFGNAASRSLQMPDQLQQRALRGPGLTQGRPGRLAGRLGEGFGDDSPGIFGENQRDRSSGGFGATPGASFGSGGGAGRPTGFPGGLGDSLTGSGSGDGSLGSGRDLGLGAGAAAGLGRRPGSPDTGSFLGSQGPNAGSGGGFGFGTGPSGGNGPFSGASGTGGRGGVGGLPGSPGTLGLPSPTPGGIGNGFGASGNIPESGFGSGGSIPGQSRTGTDGRLGGTRGPNGLPGLQGENPSTSGLRPPSATNGPPSTAGIGGNAVGAEPFPSQSSGSGAVPPFESQAGPGSSGFPSPGGAAGPGLSMGGSPTQTGSNGSGATGSAAGPGGEGAGTGLASRHPGTRPGRHPKKLSPEDAAAIGLGVASSALAFGALAAGIISAVNQRKQARLRATARPSGATGAAGAAGPAGKPPCASNTGRRRRSIAESKVPAEVLDSIPMNFEHLD
ncbi:uncharacterized protein LOC144141484 isoform X2 [Haemaphysalis longicornis]